MGVKKPRSRKQIAATKKMLAARKKQLLAKKRKAPARKKATVRKRKGARRNPVPKTAGKMKEAISLYKRFREEQPEFVDELVVPSLDVAMQIGKCDAVEYTTRRNGKIERYRHEFTGKSKPTLIASWDGQQIAFIGGEYDFTEDGIVDRATDGK